MAAAMERAKSEADYAVAKERRGRNCAAKARRKDVNERPANDAPVAGKHVTARSDQKTSGVVIEDSVVPDWKVATGATHADVRSVQVTGGA